MMITQRNILRFSAMMLLAVIALFLVFPSHASAAVVIPGVRDIRLVGVSCTADGVALPPSLIDTLWSPGAINPEMEAGPPLNHRWSGSGRLICTWSFAEPLAWSAFETESKLNASLASIKVMLYNGSSVEVLNGSVALTPGKKSRAQLPEDVPATAITVEIRAQCSGGNCEADLAEITPIAPSIDVTVLAVNMDGEPRSAFLPGEPFFVRGGADSRSYVCEGALRYRCAWTKNTQCVSQKQWWGTQRWCTFTGCPANSARIGTALFLSSDNFDSGRCVSKSGWFLPVVGIIGNVVAAVLPPPFGIPVALFSGALMVWNPGVPLSDQWAQMAVSAAISAITVGMARASFLDLSSKFEALGFSEAAAPWMAGATMAGSSIVSYGTSQLVTPPLQETVGAELGSILGGAIGATAGGFVTNSVLKGFADTVATATGNEYVKLMSTMSLGEFARLQARTAAWTMLDSAIRGALMTYTTQAATELCIQEAKPRTALEVAALCAGIAQGLNIFLYDTFVVHSEAYQNIRTGVLGPETVAVEKAAQDFKKKVVFTPGPEFEISEEEMDVAKQMADQGSARKVVDPEDPQKLVIEYDTGNGYVRLTQKGDQYTQTYYAPPTDTQLEDNIRWASNNHLQLKENIGDEAKVRELRETYKMMDGNGRIPIDAEIKPADLAYFNIVKATMTDKQAAFMLNWLKEAKGAENFRKEFMRYELVGWINQVYQLSVVAVQNTQTLAQTMAWLSTAADQQRKQLEQQMQGMKCGCYGYFMAHPQYLLDPVQCWGAAGVTPVIIGPVGEFGLTSAGEIGNGWCERDLTADGVKAIREGTATTSVSSEATEVIENMRTLGQAGIEIVAPLEIGTHDLEVRVSKTVTGILVARTKTMAEDLKALPGGMTGLPIAIAEVEIVLADMIKGGFYDAAQRLSELNTTLHGVVDRQVELPAYARNSIEAAIARLREFEVAANSTASQAGTAGAGIIKLRNSATDARIALGGILANRSINDMNEALIKIFSAKSELSGFKKWSSSYILGLKNYTESFRRGSFELSWAPGENKQCDITSVTADYEEYTCRFSFGTERDISITPRDMDTTAIAWELGVYRNSSDYMQARWPEVEAAQAGGGYEITFRQRSGTYTADTRLDARAGEAAATIERLANATEKEVANATGSSPSSEYTATANAAKAVLAGLKSSSEKIIRNVAGLFGVGENDSLWVSPGIFDAPAMRCMLYDMGWLERVMRYCSFDGNDVSCLSAGARQKLSCSSAEELSVRVISTDRRQIAIAGEGGRLLGIIADILEEAINKSEEAAWNAVLARNDSYGRALGNLSAAADALNSAMTDALAAAGSEVGAAVNRTRLDIILVQFAATTQESMLRTTVDVIEPRFEISASPDIACGAGESLPYTISIMPSAEWPIISVAANTWTPFSVPFAPKKGRTLKASDVVSRCGSFDVAWWDMGLGRGVTKRGEVASNTVLEPGRGYFIRSSNDCELRFSFELFEPSGTVNLTGLSPSSPNSLVLIGAGSMTMPFDLNSITHRLNPFTLLENILGDVSIDCPMLKERVWPGFALPRPGAGSNYTKVIEAVPSTGDPFAGAKELNPSGRVVDTMEPGKAYWVWTTKPGGCKLRDIDGSLPTTDLGLPKGVDFNISASLPSGWSWGKWKDGLSDSSDWISCTAEDCAGMARSVTKTKSVKPVSPADRGEHELIFTVRSDSYNFSKSASAKYYLKPVRPILSMEPNGSGLFLAKLTNGADSFCSAQTFFIYTEKPFGWQASTTGNRALRPGETADMTIRVGVTTRAKGGGLNIIAAAETTERARSLRDFDNPCVPQESAKDIASNGTYIFYATLTGISEYDGTKCESLGELVQLDYAPRGIAANATSILWIDDSNIIKEYILSSGAVREVSAVSRKAHHLAVDGPYTTAVYWIDGNSLMRLSAGAASEIAGNLSEPGGLDADAENVYWAEGGSIKYLNARANERCAGKGCRIFSSIPQDLLGDGFVTDVFASGDELFATISSMGYAKVVRINKADRNVRVAAKSDAMEIGGVVADESYIWFIGDGFADRMNRHAEIDTESAMLEVPGHNPPIVTLTPVPSEGAAGSAQKFRIGVTNNNTNLTEPLSYFWLKGFDAPGTLRLCWGGIGYLDCEGEKVLGKNMTREDILEEYSNSPTRALRQGESSNLTMWIKPSPVLAVGTDVLFTIAVGSDDQLTDATIDGHLIVTPPGPPQVVIIPGPVAHNHCGALPDGYINRSCSHPYAIEITNPEQLMTRYRIEVTAPGDGWEIKLDNDTVDVPGWESIFGNVKRVGMSVRPLWYLPFGVYRFAVNVTNIAFPSRFNSTSFELVITADNLNGVCEPERGEDAETTADCRAGLFSCPFGERCEQTTPYGTDFSAIFAVGTPVTDFVACKAGEGGSRDFSIEMCKREFESGKAGQRVLCSAVAVNRTPRCRWQCMDRSGSYILLAKVNGSWEGSNIWNYACPQCLGKFYSPLIQTDWWMYGAEYREGITTLDFWIDYVRAEHMRADLFGTTLPECEVLLEDIVRRAFDFKAEAARIAQNPTFPVDGACADVRQRVGQFLLGSDSLVFEVCRQKKITARLNITGLEIVNETFGVAEARLEIRNSGNSSAYARAGCAYEGSSSVSGCRQLAAGETAYFKVMLSGSRLGANSGMCYAAWSTLSDCEVTVNVDSKAFNFTTIAPATEIKIQRVDAPEYGITGRISTLQINANNSGESAMASASCRLARPDGTDIDSRGDSKRIGFGQSTMLLVKWIPAEQGEWTVRDCTVYADTNGTKTPHHTLAVGRTITVMDACSGACQDEGYEAGECRSDPAGLAVSGGYGEHGCGPTQICTCGRISFENVICTKPVGVASDYTASGSLTWSIGSYARMGGTTISSPGQFNIRFPNLGVHTLDATLYSNEGRVIGSASRSVDCAVRAVVNITSPKAGATVWGDVRISARIFDAERVETMVDNVPIGEKAKAPFDFSWDSRGWPDGSHSIRVQACNPIGCEWQDIVIESVNEGRVAEYDFSFDPSATASTAKAGSTVELRFRLTNTGSKADRFVLSESVSKEWHWTVAIGDEAMKRTVQLGPNQSAIFSMRLVIPSDAAIGEYVDVGVNAASSAGGARKSLGPHTITVADVQRSAPEIISTWHTPQIPTRLEVMTFSADISDDDGSPISEAKACRDADCRAVWCTFTTQNKSSGLFSCQTTPSEAGNFTYFIYAEDADGLSATSDERNFWVAEQAVLVGRDNVGANASMSSSSSVPGKGIENAIDRDPFTYWVSGAGLPQWVLIDLKEIKNTGGIGIFSRAPARPRTFRVETSPDCLIYNTSLDERAAHYSEDGWYRRNFVPAWARCLRLWISGSEDGSDYTAISELEIYAGLVQPKEPKPAETHPLVPPESLPWVIAVVAAAAACILAFVFGRRIAILWKYWRG